MKRRELLSYTLFGAVAAAIPLSVKAHKQKIPDGYVSVESFGIVPDEVTNWEGTIQWEEMLQASVKTGVYWPAGYYATGINFRSDLSGAKMHFEPGSVIGGVFHLISGPVKLSQISSIKRVSGLLHIELTKEHRFHAGEYLQVRMNDDSSFNGDRLYVSSAEGKSLILAQDGSDEIGRPKTASSVNPAPLENVRITGLLTTTDRFGTINCKNCYVESCWVMNDPSRHSAYPGQPSRGAHIYVGTDGLTVDSLVIDHAGGANTAAAFSMDGHFWNPTNCRFGRVHIKDSECHGAYITGHGHRFDSIRIDSFAAVKEIKEVLQDSNGIEQTKELKGLWINRCWDTSIKLLVTNQSVSSRERYETHHALIDETGNSIYGVRDGLVTIDDWLASNVRRKGISVGDEKFDSVYSSVKASMIKIIESEQGVDGGYSLFSCNSASIGCYAVVSKMDIQSTTGRKTFVANNSSLNVGQFI